MGKKSRDKGKVGEREFALLMRAHGFEARRGQQHRGTNDSPDIIHDMNGFAVEVKRREEFSINDLYAALDKAQNEASAGDDAVVFYRRNRKPWIVVMDGDRFLSLMEEIYEQEAK